MQDYSLILFRFFQILNCQGEKAIMWMEAEKTYCHWLSTLNILKEKPFLVASINHQISA